MAFNIKELRDSYKFTCLVNDTSWQGLYFALTYSYSDRIRLRTSRMLGSTDGTHWDSPGANWLIHCSGCKYNGMKASPPLGLWYLRTAEKVVTQSSDITDIYLTEPIPAPNLYYHWQAVYVPTFSGTYSDSVFHGSVPQCQLKKDTLEYLVGGILAIKADFLDLRSSQLCVHGSGLPANETYATIRPALDYEINTDAGIRQYGGHENGLATSIMPMNIGDGLVFLFTNRLNVSTSTRIGSGN